MPRLSVAKFALKEPKEREVAWKCLTDRRRSSLAWVSLETLFSGSCWLTFSLLYWNPVMKRNVEEQIASNQENNKNNK